MRRPKGYETSPTAIIFNTGCPIVATDSVGRVRNTLPGDVAV